MQGEIDAREDSFRATAEAGQLLVDNEHFAAPEVAEKLITLSTEKQNLLTIWEERRILYEQGGGGHEIEDKEDDCWYCDCGWSWRYGHWSRYSSFSCHPSCSRLQCFWYELTLFPIFL